MKNMERGLAGLNHRVCFLVVFRLFRLAPVLSLDGMNQLLSDYRRLNSKVVRERHRSRRDL